MLYWYLTNINISTIFHSAFPITSSIFQKMCITNLYSLKKKYKYSVLGSFLLICNLQVNGKKFLQSIGRWNKQSYVRKLGESEQTGEDLEQYWGGELIGFHFLKFHFRNSNKHFIKNQLGQSPSSTSLKPVRGFC